MRIAIYGIALNEAKFVDRFMDACADADHVIIADTGSSDGTADMLRARGAQVHAITVTPWRFDDARNAALSLVPGDVDICVSMDLDEVLAPGWRKALEEGWLPGTTQARYTLVYSHLQDGSPDITFLNTRIHARHGYRWRHACHEALYADRIEPIFVVLPHLRVDHWPDLEKSRSSYLGLLEAAVREEPGSSRMAHYLAREYNYVGRHEEALAEFERYFAMPGNSFVAERISSLLLMAKSAVALQRDPAPYYFRALSEAPNRRELWLGLAEHYYRQSAWSDCHAMALRGLAITVRDESYPADAYYWGSLGEDLAAIAAWNLGLKTEALAHARAALAISPDDDRLKGNVAFMDEAIQP